MMAIEKIDYKKQDKALYSPTTSPSIIDVPRMQFVAVSGRGDPNEIDGEYQRAMSLLYGISFTIKMSKYGKSTPLNYHDYVVPPLEGLWDIDLDEIHDFGVADKSKFDWISMIRLPEFVKEPIFEWAKSELIKKKPELDFSKLFYFDFEEGTCAQIMHVGPYDDESRSIKSLEDFVESSGFTEDFDLEKHRYHHEIYLGDPRKTAPSKLRTIIRHPIKK